MSIYRTLLTRETTTGLVIDSYEAYRGPSLAEAVRVRGLAIAVLEIHFSADVEPRPALGIRILSPAERGDFVLAQWVLAEVDAPRRRDDGSLVPVTIEAP